ncbi:hypothetical protein [Bifidobacterium bifidum]|uniref:hypothetical protein n=1 Tax=Bifidobacterium bifidum TaxID=1681 RepID=UPI003CFEA4E1
MKALYDELLAIGPTARQHVIQNISGIYTYAVRNGIAKTNPITGITRLKPTPAIKERQTLHIEDWIHHTLGFNGSPTSQHPQNNTRAKKEATRKLNTSNPSEADAASPFSTVGLAFLLTGVP